MAATSRDGCTDAAGVSRGGQRAACIGIMARLSVLLLLLVPSLPCDEAVGHVPLTPLKPSQESPLRQSQPQVIRTSLCRGCCPSHCWWDAAAVTCRCPHRRAPLDSLTKYPHLLGMSLSSLLAQSSDSRQRPRIGAPSVKSNIRRRASLQPFPLNPSGSPASPASQSEQLPSAMPLPGTDSSAVYTTSTNQLSILSHFEQAGSRQTSSGGDGTPRRKAAAGITDYAVRFGEGSMQQFHVFRPLHPPVQHSSSVLGLTGRRWDEARRRLG